MEQDSVKPVANVEGRVIPSRLSSMAAGDTFRSVGMCLRMGYGMIGPYPVIGHTLPPGS